MIYRLQIENRKIQGLFLTTKHAKGTKSEHFEFRNCPRGLLRGETISFSVRLGAYRPVKLACYQDRGEKRFHERCDNQ